MKTPDKDKLSTAGYPTLAQLRTSEERYYARKRGEKPAGPPTEYEKAYVQKMKARELEERDISVSAIMGQLDRRAPRRSFTPYPYTFDEVYPLALRIHEARLAALGRSLRWEGDAEAIFGDLVRYFIGDASGSYDLHRGIYIFGSFGVGKTLLMQTFADMTHLIEQRLANAEVAYTPRTFRFSYCKDIALEIQRAATIDSLRPYFTATRLFDDLGNEEEKKIYGNQVNAMAEILMARYNAWQTSGTITHCTSNLPPHDARDAYGERIGSRVFELFNHVYLDGRDKRQ